MHQGELSPETAAKNSAAQEARRNWAGPQKRTGTGHG